MPPDQSVSIELELTEDGYRRLCHLSERLARIGGNPSLSHIIALALQTGTDAISELVTRAELENAGANVARLPASLN